jgi:DNA-binding transcriptional regulator GbsR (MarR family)
LAAFEEDKTMASQVDREQFVEDAGIIFELVGLPRMAGRILGWLLICEPPPQSPQELAEALQASKGSISTNTRLLVQYRLLERMSLPGERRTYYTLSEDIWSEMIRIHMQEITLLKELAESGLDLVENEPTERQQQLIEMHGMYSFFEHEYPSLIERGKQPSEKDK